jgi:hypothetical protein
MSTLPITTFDLPEITPARARTTLINRATLAKRWDLFLGEIAAGMTLGKAMKAHKVCRADIETMCRLNDGGVQQKRWDDARVAGAKRGWTLFEFEDVMQQLASGKTIDEAMIAVKGVPAGQTQFYWLLAVDEDLQARYRKAKQAYSLMLGEGIVEIADNKTGDTLPGPKGGEIPNMANVTRDKLRIDARWRYMAAYHTRLFGEKKDTVNVQVNVNHAERLEEARERAKLQDKRVTPKQMADAVEAVFSEKTEEPAPEVTEWVDEEPTAGT